MSSNVKTMLVGDCITWQLEQICATVSVSPVAETTQKFAVDSKQDYADPQKNK